MRFAARTLQGMGEDGGREEILIWIERRPGAVWAVGLAIDLGNRRIPQPRPDDYVFEGYEMGDALEAANTALKDDLEVSAEEGLMLLREGKRQGVQHMVVTHAHVPYIAMTVPQMQEAAKLGAFIEFAGASIADADGQAKMDMFAATIPKVGAEFCILSADLGLKGDALPPDGFAAIILALKARGIPERDLDLMTKRNPARVLGLP